MWRGRRGEISKVAGNGMRCEHETDLEDTWGAE